MLTDHELTRDEITEYLLQWVAHHYADHAAPIADLFDNGERWMAEAACTATKMPDAWFPGPGHNHRNDPVSAAAMTVCHDICPVAAECLTYALKAERDGHRLPGIWGGMSAYQRHAMLRDERHAS